MKARNSERFYRENWDRFNNPKNEIWGANQYMDFEGDLQNHLNSYRQHGAPEEAMPHIEVMTVKKIVERSKKKLVEQMKVIKAVDAGKTSYGYTNQSQEIRHRREARIRFEFNCLKLSDFIKAHKAE